MPKQIERSSSALAELQLNRLLFERRGDDFMIALAMFVEERKLQVDEDALLALSVAVRTARTKKH